MTPGNSGMATPGQTPGHGLKQAASKTGRILSPYRVQTTLLLHGHGTLATIEAKAPLSISQVINKAAVRIHPIQRDANI